MTLVELIDKGIITRIEASKGMSTDVTVVYFKTPNMCDIACTIYDDSIQLALDLIDTLYEEKKKNSRVNSSME